MFTAYLPESGVFVLLTILHLAYTVLAPEKVLSKYIWNESINKWKNQLVSVKKKYSKDINLGRIIVPNMICKFKAIQL